MNFLTILGFIKKEFKQSLRDKKTKILIFGAPLIQLTIFGFAISNEIKNQKLYIANPRQEILISEISEHAYATDIFIKENDKSKAEVLLYFKDNSLEKNLNSQKNNSINIQINAVNAVSAKSSEFYLKQIINSVLAKRLPKMNESQSYDQINLQTKILYNPEMKTSFYMIPGVMCMILCLITIILTGMSIAKENEQGTFEMILATHIKPSELVVGKILPFIILGLIDLALISIFATIVFGLPFRGSLIIFTIMSILFILTTTSIGLLISAIAKNQQQAMLGGFIFMLPAILLSGLLYPLENMPDAVKFIAYLNPLKYFVLILRTLCLKGDNLQVIWQNGLMLALFSIITITFSYNKFKKIL